MDLSLSVVTAVKDRAAELVQSARALSASKYHTEHIIIDWGSNPPLSSLDFAFDRRIKVFRVDTTLPWWLSQAYNLGFSLASGSIILKVDADILLSPGFFESNRSKFDKADFSCSRLTYQDWLLGEDLFTTNGLFWVKRCAIQQVSGFNPYIYGWGWDDMDLYSRLFLAGFSAVRLESHGVSEIKHSDSQRVSMLSKVSRRAKSLGLSSFQLREISNSLNRVISCACIKKKIPLVLLDSYLEEYQANHLVPLPLDAEILAGSEIRTFLNYESSKHICHVNQSRIRRLVNRPTAPYRIWQLKCFIRDQLVSQRPVKISIL